MSCWVTLCGLRDIKRQLLSKVWNQQVMDCSFVNIETHMKKMRKKERKKKITHARTQTHTDFDASRIIVISD